MADFMMYYKNYWRDVEDSGLDESFDWHTSHEPTFDALQPGDDVWVIVRDKGRRWKLLERIRVQSKEVDPDRESREVQEYGAYHIVGDPASSKRFDIAAPRDLESVLTQLEFATGVGLHASGAQIGNKFQAPRVLSEGDAKMLRDFEAQS